LQIGIQTNAWPDEAHRRDLPGVLDGIAATGYTGLEIGSHRVDLDRPAALRGPAERRGLAVVGVHVGGELWNPAAPPDVEARVARVAAYAAAVGATFVPVSGGRKAEHTAEDYANDAKALDRLGTVCADHGLRLAYHNHDWEITGGCAGLRAICERTDPRLVSLALDVGWVAKAGEDPAQTVSAFLGRVGYLHVKDTLDDWFTELGRGTANLGPLGAFLRDHWDGWLVVERDKAMDHPLESAAVSREYLRARWGL